MSRPIQFIPDLDSVQNRQFVEMWSQETPIIRMMEHFQATRTTILTHAARAGLPMRNYELTAKGKEERRAQVRIEEPKEPQQPVLVTLRCEACHGQYIVDTSDSGVTCPYCSCPANGSMPRRVYGPQR